MERCFALLFCLFAFVSGECCTKTIDYCPSQSIIPSFNSRTCTSFGSGHIHTFDGLSYDFHEYGDFYLMTSYDDPTDWSIQVRQSDCSSKDTLAVPVNQKTSFKGTCNRAFLFNSGSTVEIRHDVNTDYVTILSNNAELPVSGYYGSLGDLSDVRILPLAYVAPTGDISRSPGADADFLVTGNFAGLEFKIWFYANGYSTFQILITTEQPFGMPLGGLCGFTDGCMANDLALRTHAPLNPPSAAPAKIVETVGETSGVVVTAGGLNNDTQFINKTDNPKSWAPAFGSSWRVPIWQGFPVDAPNLRWTESDYSLSGGDCNFPSGWSTPQFLQKQCSIDRQFNSDTVNGFPFDALPSWHVMASYCSYYCDNGVFPFYSANLLPNQCNGYCAYPQGVTEGEPDITTVYGEAPDWNKPDFKFYQTSTPNAIFSSALNLAGEYSFTVTNVDSCETREFDVKRTLRCTNKVSLAPFTYSPVVKRIHSYGGIYPTVQIFFPVPSNFVRVQATFVGLPEGLSSYSFISLYGDAGDKSFAPMFTPDPEFPGTYTIQFSVFDGCSIVRQNISVIAACSSCAPVAKIDNPNLKDFIWGTVFDVPTNGPIPTNSANPTFPMKSFHAGSVPTNEPYTASDYNYEWTLVNDDNPNDLIVLNTPTTYQVRRFLNPSIASFATTYPFGLLVNSTSNSTTSEPVVSAPVIGPTPVLPALKGPTNSQYGVSPPPREFDIRRFDTKTTTVTTTTATTYSEVSYFQFATWTVPCTVTVNQISSQNVTVQFTPAPPTMFNYGSRCVGQYNLRLNASESSCASAKDEQKLDVDCGPNPDIFVKCVATTKFDYGTKSFPTVTINATDSSDPYNRPLNFSMVYLSTPVNNSAAQLSPVIGNVRVATATVFDEGTYEVLVNTSNGCNSASTVSTFKAYCTGSASEVSSSFLFASNPVVYTGATWGSESVGTIQQSSTTNPDSDSLDFTWSFVDLPSTPLWEQTPTISSTTSSQPTITLTYDSAAFKVKLRADQGCGQYAEQTSTITLFCDSQYTPVLSMNPASPDVAWVKNVGWTAPTYSGQPQALFNTAPEDANAQNRHWMTNTPQFANDSQQALTTGVTNLVYSPAAPPVTSGGVTTTVTYYTSDGCHTATATPLAATYHCYTSTLSFVVSAVQQDNDQLVTMDASASDLSMDNILPTWTVTSPTGEPVTTIQINQFNATFVASLSGNYMITMQYDDLCANFSTQATYTAPPCKTLILNPGAYIGDDTANVTSVTWGQDAFPKFELNGDGSQTGGRNITTLTNYIWTVFAAPSASIFAPKTTSITAFSPTNNITDFIGLIDGYNYYRTSLTWASTLTNTYSYVTLNPSTSINPETWWPSCFYPDVDGTYVVGLTVSDGCQVKTSNLTLYANCAPAPTAIVNVSEHSNFNNETDGPRYVTATKTNEWSVTLRRAAPRRVVLDARGSTSNSNSRLTYYWAWNTPDPRAGTADAQDGIETPYASTSAISISAVGNYSLLLTVHDGCAYSTQAIKLTATCGDAKLAAPASSQDLSTNGRTYATIRLNIAGTCGQTTWTFTNYTSSPKFAASGISNLAFSVNPSLFLIFTLLAFVKYLY